MIGQELSGSELMTQGPKLPIYTKGKLGPKYKPMGRNQCWFRPNNLNDYYRLENYINSL